MAIIILSGYCLTGCGSIEKSEVFYEWQYTDLRLLDPVDAAQTNQDIIAAYLRENNGDFQIRLDLLESSNWVDYDIYLLFDCLAGGSDNLPIQANPAIMWDILLKIPAYHAISLQKSDGSMPAGSGALIIRNIREASILIDIDRKVLADLSINYPIYSSVKMQVFLTPAGSKEIADLTGVFKLDDNPPEPAQVLFVFWDTYPAYTPASALRRWDGAHTGPKGGRHGLHNLLRSAAANKIPLFLMDLNNPASLSALDYADQIAIIHELQHENLLILPKQLQNDAYGPSSLSPAISSEIFNWSEQVSSAFGVLDHGYSFTPDSIPTWLPENEQVFITIRDKSSISNVREGEKTSAYPALNLIRWKNGSLIPFYQPSYDAAEIEQFMFQTDSGGLSTVWKRILLQNAIAASQDTEHPNQYYINLGGELPNSTWGDPAAARAGFRWVREHPWIRVLNAHDIATLSRLPAGQVQTSIPNSDNKSTDDDDKQLEKALLAAPQNSIGQAAWQVIYTLYAPVFPYSEDLSKLRGNYVGQAWSMLAAADWAENPINISTCDSDPDRDGSKECVLASPSTYAQFEISDGSLTFLFAFEPASSANQAGQTEVHQLIGPSSQIITGLSQPNGLESKLGTILGSRCDDRRIQWTRFWLPNTRSG